MFYNFKPATKNFSEYETLHLFEWMCFFIGGLGRKSLDLNSFRYTLRYIRSQPTVEKYFTVLAGLYKTIPIYRGIAAPNEKIAKKLIHRPFWAQQSNRQSTMPIGGLQGVTALTLSPLLVMLRFL